MNKEELIAKLDSGETFTPAEIGYHMTDEEHRQAYATAVVYSGGSDAVGDAELWAERANLSIIYDADGNAVGWSDPCPSD